MKASAPESPDVARDRTRPLDLLRLLLVASIVGPVLVFGILGFITYRAAFSDAREELTWTSEVVREHASKVFDSYKLVTDRVQDILRAPTDGPAASREAAIHRQLVGAIAGLPQIESLIVLDRDGHLQAATDAFPVDRSIEFSDRDYFRALRQGVQNTFISRVQTSRLSHKTFFGWGRSVQGADSAFDGVIDVAVSPDFFASFFGTLVSEVGDSTEGRVVTLIRDDGQILVRYPTLPGLPPAVQPSNPFFEAVRKTPEAGLYTNHSVIDPHGQMRLFAFRKVPGHPIYVVAGRSLDAIRGEWWTTMFHYLLVAVPGAATLFLLTLATLRGARREHVALAQVQAEMGRRERAEEQLRQSQKMEAIGQLTGGLAHDFNNLLTVIQSSVDLLRRPSLPEDRRRRYIEAIAETANRAAKLTGQLLAFARRQTLEPEVFDAADHVATTVEMLRNLIEPRVVIVVERPDEALFVDADPSQFDTAIVNLIVNARDAIPGQGRITISVQAAATIPAFAARTVVSGSYVAIAVADTGTGIAAERLDRIFEPFFTTKGRGQGTGLGLSQVFGFAKQSKGEIAVESEMGRGTTFTLSLPRTAAPTEERIPAEPRVAGKASGTRVLVVEDDPGVGRVVMETLTDLGYVPELASSAEEALAELDRRQDGFDIVFSDVVMPGMDGIALGREIQRRRADLPVVLTSGYSDSLAETGPQGFELLRKPYSVEQLATVLQKAMVVESATLVVDRPSKA